jgi:soluble lytic murein transglycosylase-like protein
VNYTLAQLQALAASVGFPDPALAAAVAMAESGGNPTIVGDTGPGVNGPSIGLWQIDLFYHKQYTQAQMDDPVQNAQAAFAISSKGTNWTPWSTYNSGAYKKYYTGPSSPTAAQPMSFGQKLLIGAAGLTLAGFAIVAVHDAVNGRPIFSALRT